MKLDEALRAKYQPESKWSCPACGARVRSLTQHDYYCDQFRVNWILNRILPWRRGRVE